LGVAFLAAQMTAWFQLVGNGFYVNTNRRSGFAYIFTVLHAIHLLGGIGALGFVLFKSKRGLWTAVRRRSAVDATVIYWHFLCALWLYILAILFVWGR
jgi:cytochrome c oxidase subunit III